MGSQERPVVGQTPDILKSGIIVSTYGVWLLGPRKGQWLGGESRPGSPGKLVTYWTTPKIGGGTGRRPLGPGKTGRWTSARHLCFRKGRRQTWSMTSGSPGKVGEGRKYDYGVPRKDWWSYGHVIPKPLEARWLDGNANLGLYERDQTGPRPLVRSGLPSIYTTTGLTVPPPEWLGPVGLRTETGR